MLEPYQSLIGPGIFGILPEAINISLGPIGPKYLKPKRSKPSKMTKAPLKNISLKSRYHAGTVLRKPGQPL